jgi:ectoine hydroxylase-related dioxygenase (phytanoyl-CoA dioxygenase family)
MTAIGEHGFEIVPQVFGQRILLSITKELNDAPLRRSRAGIRNAFKIEVVRSLASEERLVDLARNVLGAHAVPFRATLFDKSPASNWLVVWHQDTALPLRDRREISGWGPWSVKEGVTCAHAPASALEQVLAIRVHLDDSTEENGPLKVLPGTHGMGVLTDDAIHNLAISRSAVECHVPAGGILLMRPLLVHASSKAKTSARSRRVLHIEYSARTCFPEGIELAVS